MMAMKSATAAAPQFEQEAISEYHLYTLERPTNIQNNETKQISLLAAAGAAMEKVFEVDGQSYYYQNPQSPGQPTKEPVKVSHQIQERGGELAGSSAAGGDRARLPGGFQRPRAIHR